MKILATLALFFLVYNSNLRAVEAGSPKHKVVEIQKDKELRNHNAAQVRILLKMKPYAHVVIRSPKGESTNKVKEEAESIYTLRARINEPNHFYFADWHVQSTPILWRKEMREYAVQLSFFRTFGMNKELEEQVGIMEVKGHLVASEDKVFNLIATKSSSFKNARGENLLVVSAGFDPKDESLSRIVRKE